MFKGVLRAQGQYVQSYEAVQTPEGQAFAGIACIDAKVVSEKIHVRLAI